MDLCGGLQLCEFLLSYNEVLQVLALSPAQHLGVIHIQQSPHPVWSLGDAHGSIAGQQVSRYVLIWHFEPVCDSEAVELQAVFHTDSANLTGDGAVEMSYKKDDVIK